jgi:CHAD domain-containing protein
MAMKQTLEREIKLRAGAGFALPPELGEPIEARRFSSTYHDTPDHRLAWCGITLRYRAERGAGAWQLKLPADDDRLEIELEGSPREVPQAFLDLLPAVTRGRPVRPAATLVTRRHGLMVRERGRDLAEVLMDEVRVTARGAAISRLSEVEVELVDGDGGALTEIEHALRDAGARDGDERPKLFRALGLEPSGPAAPRRGARPVRQLAAMLQAQYREILRNDPGTRLGTDPEHLHQHRVAIRRMRALLRAGAPLLDRPWVKELRAELAWAGGALGDVRDLDVLLEHLRDDAAELEPADREAVETLLPALESRRDAARAAMLTDLGSARYMRLLDRLETELPAPPARATGRTLEKIARKEFRALRREVRDLGPDPSDEQLHEVRKTVKHARYAAELAEVARGRKAARFISAAKRVQDVLGDHQDAHVAEQAMRDLAEVAQPRAAAAAELVIARQRVRRAHRRAEFPEAWRALKRRGRAAWS